VSPSSRRFNGYLICILFSNRFELLLRAVGKQLPANIYELITYIEANTLDEEAQQHTKKRKVQAERAKVLRETRLIPKVIMVIEDFNKHIILLSKKTKSKNRLTDYLHLGTMRDFDIKSTDLRAAIERSISDGRNISTEDSNAEDRDEDEDENENVEEDDDAQSTTYPEDLEEKEDECLVIEKKEERRRRRAPSSEAEDPQPKRKRGRKAAEQLEAEDEEQVEEEQPETTLKLRRNKKVEPKTKRSVAIKKPEEQPSHESRTSKRSKGPADKQTAEPAKVDLCVPEVPAEKKKPQPSRRLGIPRTLRK